MERFRRNRPFFQRRKLCSKSVVKSDLRSFERFLLYFFQGSSWTSLTSLPHNTHHHGVALLNNKLYVIGGSIYNPNGAGHLGDAISNVNVFDIRTRSWSEASPMIWRRTYLSVAGEYKLGQILDGLDVAREKRTFSKSNTDICLI